jgi:hypothetical protein
MSNNMVILNARASNSQISLQPALQKAWLLSLQTSPLGPIRLNGIGITIVKQVVTGRTWMNFLVFNTDTYSKPVRSFLPPAFLVTHGKNDLAGRVS